MAELRQLDDEWYAGAECSSRLVTRLRGNYHSCLKSLMTRGLATFESRSRAFPDRRLTLPSPTWKYREMSFPSGQDNDLRETSLAPFGKVFPATVS